MNVVHLLSGGGVLGGEVPFAWAAESRRPPKRCRITDSSSCGGCRCGCSPVTRKIDNVVKGFTVMVKRRVQTRARLRYLFADHVVPAVGALPHQTHLVRHDGQIAHKTYRRHRPARRICIDAVVLCWAKMDETNECMKLIKLELFLIVMRSKQTRRDQIMRVEPETHNSICTCTQVFYTNSRRL